MALPADLNMTDVQLARLCREQDAEITRLKKGLVDAREDAIRLHKLATDRWAALLELRCRDDKDGSLPQAYIEIIDAVLNENPSEER